MSLRWPARAGKPLLAMRLVQSDLVDLIMNATFEYPRNRSFILPLEIVFHEFTPYRLRRKRVR